MSIVRWRRRPSLTDRLLGVGLRGVLVVCLAGGLAWLGVRGAVRWVHGSK